MGMGVQEWVPHGFEPAAADPRAPGSPTETGEWNALDPIVNLNVATFEDLRELGLSVQETLRLLSARELRRFDSLSAIERIEELPHAARATIRRSCRV